MSHLISIPLATCFQILARCDASDDIKRVIRDAIDEKITALENSIKAITPRSTCGSRDFEEAALKDFPKWELIIHAVPIANAFDIVQGIKAALGCDFITAREIYTQVRGEWNYETREYENGKPWCMVFPSIYASNPVWAKLRELGLTLSRGQLP